MGDEADYLIEQQTFRWETQLDGRLNHPHMPNCRCCAKQPQEKKKRKQHLSIEQAFKEAEPYDVPTHIICNRCQAAGLHWGLKDGKPEMREEGGWPHKCKKIEGVTLNLPNILDPQ